MFCQEPAPQRSAPSFGPFALVDWLSQKCCSWCGPSSSASMWTAILARTEHCHVELSCCLVGLHVNVAQMYEMGKQIGAGTFGTVWKAKHTQTLI